MSLRCVLSPAGIAIWTLKIFLGHVTATVNIIDFLNANQLGKSFSARFSRNLEITVAVLSELPSSSSTLFLFLCDASSSYMSPNKFRLRASTIKKYLQPHTAGLRYLKCPGRPFTTHQHRNPCLAHSVCLDIRPRCEAQLLTNQPAHNKRYQPPEPERGPIAYA